MAVMKSLGDQAGPVQFVGFHFKSARPIPIFEGQSEARSRRVRACRRHRRPPRRRCLPALGRVGPVLRNVYLRGVTTLEGVPIADTADWTWVKEYNRPGDSFKNLVDGVESTTPRPTSSKA